MSGVVGSVVGGNQSQRENPRRVVRRAVRDYEIMNVNSNMPIGGPNAPGGERLYGFRRRSYSLRR
jgi:hypothetical protein